MAEACQAPDEKRVVVSHNDARGPVTQGAAGERFIVVWHHRPVWHVRYVWRARQEPINRHDPDVAGAKSSWRSIIEKDAFRATRIARLTMIKDSVHGY